MDRELGIRESIVEHWVGSWVEVHYAASSAEVTPQGVVTGPPETRVGMYLIQAVGDKGIEAFIPDPDERRAIFIPWNSVLLIRGPSREEQEQEQAERAEEGSPLGDRQIVMDRLTRARSEADVADAIAAADEWLAANPSDGDVRLARDQLREGMPRDDTELEEGSPT